MSDGKERIGLDLVLGIGREKLAGKMCSKDRLCPLDASGRNNALVSRIQESIRFYVRVI